jgi:hypothetical protein
MDNEKTGSFYCNQTQIACTPWDVIFSLQRVALAIDESGKATNALKLADELQVAMSLAHAKMMITVLYEQIRKYETDVIKGKISLDVANQQKYDSFIASIKSLK